MGPGEIGVRKHASSENVCLLPVQLVLPNFNSSLLLHIYITLSKAPRLPQLQYLLLLSLALVTKNQFLSASVFWLFSLLFIPFVFFFFFLIMEYIHSAATI